MRTRAAIVLCAACVQLAACAIDEPDDASPRDAGSDISSDAPPSPSSSWPEPPAPAVPSAPLEAEPPAMPDALAPLDDAPDACRARLAQLGVGFRRSGELLGVRDPVVVQPPIAGVRFRWDSEDGPQVPMRMDCRLALALYAMARVLREDWRITDVVHYGTYAYRCVRGAEPCRMSQHAFGLALDLAGFVDAEGRSYQVRRDFVPNGRPSCPARAESESDQVLKDVACWMVQTRAFGLVLTPNFNAIHENHYHIGVSMRSLGDYGERPHVIDPPWVPRGPGEPAPEDLDPDAVAPELELEDPPLEAPAGAVADDTDVDRVDPVTLATMRASDAASRAWSDGALLAPRWTPALAAGGARPTECTTRAHRGWSAR